MRSAVGYAGRIRAARLVLLCLAALGLATSPGSTPLTPILFVALTIAANVLLHITCATLRLPYDAPAAVLDIAVCGALVWITGGHSSPFISAFILPAGLVAWVTTPRSCAALVALGAVVLALSAPPTGGGNSAAGFAFTVAAMAATAGVASTMASTLERSRANMAALGDLPGPGSAPDQVLQQLARAFRSLLRARATLLFIPSAEGGLVLDHVPLELDARAAEAAEELGKSPLVQTTIRARRPLLAAYATDDDRLDPEIVEALGAESLIAAPVFFHDHLAGVIVAIDRAGPVALNDEDLALAQVAVATVVAGQLTAATDPARLIIRGIREPMAVFSGHGTLIEANTLAAELFAERPGLRELAAEAARSAAPRGTAGVYPASDGAAGEEAIEAVPLGPQGRHGVIVRLDTMPTSGTSGLRQLAVAVTKAVDAPLNGVRDYAYAIARDPSADVATVRRLAEALVEQAAELSRSMDELLALTVAQIGPDDLRREPRDLGRIARERVERAQRLAGQTPIGLSGDDPVAAEVDEALLGRALDAMLASAMGLSPSGVRLSAANGPAGPRLSLELTKAVPLRLRRRVLEPFRLSREAKGLGIGLCLGRQVVIAHGGTLRFSSDGRRIDIELPPPAPTLL